MHYCYSWIKDGDDLVFCENNDVNKKLIKICTFDGKYLLSYVYAPDFRISPVKFERDSDIDFIKNKLIQYIYDECRQNIEYLTAIERTISLYKKES